MHTVENVEELCKKVRARLIDEHTPFFAISAWKLKHIESCKTKTLATDGTRLWVNPKFFVSLTPQERLFCYAHEILHDVLQHPYRCEGRDMELWNIVCDYVVNDILIADNIGTAPKSALLCPERFKGKSAEHAYAVMYKERLDKSPSAPDMESPDKEDSEDKSKVTDDSKTEDSETLEDVMGDCPTGSFSKAPLPEIGEDDMTPGDWEISTEEALLSSKEGGERGGDSSPDLNRAIQQSRETKTSWIERLRRFAEHTIPQESTWSTPNRRFLAHDIYLPSIKRNNMPKLGFGVDTSGSIRHEWLEVVFFELSSIHTQLKPKEIEVVYCNSKIQKTEIYTQDMEIALNAVGGGGTADMDFWPIVDYFNLKEGDEKPAAVLIYTDLYGKVPPEPDYPVLWIVPEWSDQPDPPYGETIRVSLCNS